MGKPPLAAHSISKGAAEILVPASLPQPQADALGARARAGCPDVPEVQQSPRGALGCQGVAGDVSAAPTHPSLSWGQPPGHLRAIHLLNMLQAISFN